MKKIKRPILVAVIGYIIGILIGLYFKFSIVLLYIIITVLYLIRQIIVKYNKQRKLNLFSIKRFFRYSKLILNFNIFLVIMIFSIISNSIVIYQNKEYKKLYNIKQIYGYALVVSDKIEKQYINVYKIKIQNKYFYLNINKKIPKELEYGDKIIINGEYIKPNQAKNHGGFNYKEYLKTLKICGTIKCNDVKLVNKNQGNIVFSLAKKISKKIKNILEKNLDEKEANIAKGILLGDTSQIEENIQENFRISNISHILAVSGMHISYLIIGTNIFLRKIFGKRKTSIIIIILLVCYMFITGFTSSVVRAGTMGILLVSSKLIYRKNDIWTTLAISIFISLIYNPFLITNIGLQFSYLGTIGIVVFYKNILHFLKSLKTKYRNSKFNRRNMIFINRIKEIFAVSISAQLMILPIMIVHFNLFSTYFLITNLLASVIIGPIIIICILSIIIPSVFSNILKILVNLLILISKIGELPFSKIYIYTPSIFQIIYYYLFIIIINFIYSVYISKELTQTVLRVRNLISLSKYRIKQRKKCIIKTSIIILIIFLILISIPKKLKINFVDVGQGDCTFITTPYNKTILIDGGGSLSDDWDVGKSILLPYILDRGYTKIDYIIISHFDQDHVGRSIYYNERIKSRNNYY